MVKLKQGKGRRKMRQDVDRGIGKERQRENKTRGGEHAEERRDRKVIKAQSGFC